MSTSPKPYRKFSVRKRRFGGKVFLMQANTLLPIRAVEEQVWDQCSGQNTVVELIVKIGLRATQEDRRSISSEVLGALDTFRALGFIDMLDKE